MSRAGHRLCFVRSWAHCTKRIDWNCFPSADTVFADPPFNLGKQYGERCADYRTEDEYLAWYKRWLRECERVLKPGGALFLSGLKKPRPKKTKK